MFNTNNKLIRWMKGLMLKYMYGMMTCKEFDDFMIDYSGGELSAQQYTRFERHLKMCRSCREYLQAYQHTIKVSQVVFPSPDEPLPADVPEDLIKAILKARKT